MTLSSELRSSLNISRKYIEVNPVTKGLVETAERWEESTSSRDFLAEPWPFLDDEE